MKQRHHAPEQMIRKLGGAPQFEVACEGITSVMES